jgi:hypothetical protein
MARASNALSVGAAKLTKMRGEFCLAKTDSSALGNPAAQTIEYKGFGSENARKMARRAFRSTVEGTSPQRTVAVTRYD